MIEDAFYGSAWSLDASVLFYTTVDDAWRPDKIWRHVVGTATSDDVVVREETDERFWIGIELTRSERFLLIEAGSKITSEVSFIPADDPLSEPV